MKRTGFRSRRHHPTILLLAFSLPLGTVGSLTLPSQTATAATAEDNTGESEASWEASAFIKAAKSGKRVEIIDRREETVEVFANPDGSSTRRSYAYPVWSRLGGEWRRTDPTLVKQSDGTVAPASSTLRMAFSGGGDTPLATMEKTGKKLELSWPAALPEPVVEGNTALYRSVLPGVDLKVIAEVDGFAEHLLINTPEAAANPALKSIKFGVKADGLQLSEEANGRLLAKDTSGEVVFSAPQPKMWEQPATGGDTAPAGEGGMAPMSLAAAEEPAEQPDSAPVGTEVSQTSLTLTPDAALLASADQFPLVVDPWWGNGYRERWAVVYSATPDASYVNGNGWNSSNPADEPRVGHNGTGRTRSFFAMNTSGIEDSTILHAQFAVTETYSWGCNAGDAGPTELWATDSINTPPTWDSQSDPSFWNTKLDADSFAHGHPNCPGNLGHDFSSAALTSFLQQAVNNDLGYVTLGLRADSDFEGKVDSFKRFKNNPVLQIDYNYKPTLDDEQAYEGTSWAPGAEGNVPVACGGTIGNNGLTLTTKLFDKDGGTITAYFSARKPDGTAITFPSTDTVSSGQTASVTIPLSALTNGNGYTWQVYGRDQEGTYSPTFGPCSFSVDQQGPVEPVTVVRLDNGEDPVTASKDTALPARVSLQLKLSHTASDLAGFCYSMDAKLSADSTRCKAGTWVDADAAKSAVITVTPTRVPLSNLRVIAYDKSGNHSPIDDVKDLFQLTTQLADFVYEGDVTPGTRDNYPHDMPGDVTGDGYADFVATTTASRFMLYAANGGTGKHLAGADIAGGGWGGALITHRGDYAGFSENGITTPDGYEDYIVRLPDNELWLYPSNGLGAPLIGSRKVINHPLRSAADPTPWQRLKQVIAVGNIDGQPGNDMITIECDLNGCTDGKARAWLYSGDVLDGDKTPIHTAPFKTTRVQIGSSGWASVTNLAVGDITGDKIPDIVGRNPALDKLLLYPGQFIKDADNNDVYAFKNGEDYAASGWSNTNRPYLTSPGNIQGKVVISSYTDDMGKNWPYKKFEPTQGQGYGDIWATTPADSRTITYADDAGVTKTTTCPTGCLLWYQGWAPGTTPALPKLVGASSWGTSITNIY